MSNYPLAWEDNMTAIPSPDPVNLEYRICGAFDPYIEISWSFSSKTDDVKENILTWNKDWVNDYKMFVMAEFQKSLKCKLFRETFARVVQWLFVPAHQEDIVWAWDTDNDRCRIETRLIPSPEREDILNDAAYDHLLACQIYEQYFWHNLDDEPEDNEQLWAYRELALGTDDIWNYHLMFFSGEVGWTRLKAYLEHFKDMMPEDELKEALNA